MIDAAPHMFMEILWESLCGKGFGVWFERWGGCFFHYVILV